MPSFKPDRPKPWRAQIHTPSGNEYGGYFADWAEAAIVENAMRLEHGMTHFRARKVYSCVVCGVDHYSPEDATACCVPESMRV